MRTYLDCIPCFLSQALWISRLTTSDEKQIKRVLDEIGMMIRDIPFNSSPPETGRVVHRKIREILGIYDPFKKIKEECTQTALGLYPFLKNKVAQSNDRLLTAVKISIAGNIIDFATRRKFDIEEEIYQILEKDFAVCDYDEFKEYLESADEILYMADNAGETVFDRVLIEEINQPVTYAVRGQPVINDATYEDAVKAGIDKIATILSSGTDAPGTVLGTTSEEFREIYNNARFIISKGQGNYEALSDEKHPIFFLLKVKCPVIAKDIGVRDGDIILKMAKEAKQEGLGNGREVR